MANEGKISLTQLTEELHSKKIFNLDTPTRELVSIAERFKQGSPGGEVGINIIIYDKYFVVTPLTDMTSRPADLGSIKVSVKGRMEGGTW